MADNEKTSINMVADDAAATVKKMNVQSDDAKHFSAKPLEAPVDLIRTAELICAPVAGRASETPKPIPAPAPIHPPVTEPKSPPRKNG